MRFYYQARTKEGELKVGIVEASNREAAIEVLENLGLYVTSIREERPFLFTIKIGKEISEKEIVLLFQQLATLLDAGVSLTQSLETLALQTKNQRLKEKLISIGDDIEAGTSFSKALSKYPEIFPQVVISIIRSGEAVGKLPYALTKVAEHLERTYTFKEEAKGIMIYPFFVLLIFIGVLLLLIFQVFPTFETLFSETQVSLPFVTKIALSFGKLLRKNFLIFVFLFGFVVLIFNLLLRTNEGKKKLDKFLLSLPFFSSFLKKIYITKIAEMWSVLISGGVPIVETFDLTKDVVGNSVYEEAILSLRDGVKAGNSLSSLLPAYSSLFPPIFIQIISVGEKTGRLDQVLTNLAKFQQNEIDRSLKKFLRTLEPLLLILMGILVGGLVASVFIPLYQIVLSY